MTADPPPLMGFSNEELEMLTGMEFQPAYMYDLQVGDRVAIPPVSRFAWGDKGVPTVAVYDVERIADSGNSTVMSFIGRDIDGRPRHLMYGNVYPCLIRRGK